jgi:hypothetical protein
MNCSSPAKATISSRRARTSRLVIPRMAPLRYVFSIPVSSPWNPVPTSSSEPTRPRVRDTPSVGVVMPLITFSSVLLPAPLDPMMPSAVPSSTLNDTSRSDQISRTSRRGAPRSRRARRASVSRRSAPWPWCSPRR